jgi:hypothetical protein
LRQAVIRRLRDLQGLGDLGDRLALPEHPVGFAQLADDLLRGVSALLHVKCSRLVHDRGRLELSQAPDRTTWVTPVGQFKITLTVQARDAAGNSATSHVTARVR